MWPTQLLGRWPATSCAWALPPLVLRGRARPCSGTTLLSPTGVRAEEPWLVHGDVRALLPACPLVVP